MRINMDNIDRLIEDLLEYIDYDIYKDIIFNRDDDEQEEFMAGARKIVKAFLDEEEM